MKQRDCKSSGRFETTRRGLRAEHGILAASLALLILGAVATSWSKDSLRHKQKVSHTKVERSPLYLPEAQYVKLITLGYNNFASDILWFNTINYFGKQLHGARDYRWLAQMCDLVTRLDKYKGFAYEFCSNMVAWEAHDYQKANDLLTRAVEAMPDRWRFWYLRGFNYWYFLNEPELAEKDLVRASKIPGAPAFLASLASRLMVNQDDTQRAIAFLQDLIKNSTDDNSRQVLKEKLTLAYISRDQRYLKEQLDLYEKEHGAQANSFQQLVDAGYLRSLPKDPYGGDYLIVDDEENPGKQKVSNSSNKSGLEFLGRNKDTGIYAMSQE